MSEDKQNQGAVAKILPSVPHTQQELEWRDWERRAASLAKGQVAIPRQFQGKPADILAVWITADELGLSRGAMLRSAFVVNGKVQLSGDLLAALAKGHGLRIEESIRDETPEGAEIPDWTAVCKAVDKEGNETVAEFSVEDAMRAGLWNSSEPWKRYPKRMLQMRARGFCLRDAIPHVMSGVYAPGELEQAEMVDITPSEPE